MDINFYCGSSFFDLVFNHFTTYTGEKFQFRTISSSNNCCGLAFVAILVIFVIWVFTRRKKEVHIEKWSDKYWQERGEDWKEVLEEE